MSISELFVDNYYDLFCNSITSKIPVNNSITIPATGLIKVSGTAVPTSTTIRGLVQADPTLLPGIIFEKTDNFVSCIIPQYRVQTITGTPSDYNFIQVAIPDDMKPNYFNQNVIVFVNNGASKVASITFDGDGLGFSFLAYTPGSGSTNIVAPFGTIGDITVCWQASQA